MWHDIIIIIDSERFLWNTSESAKMYENTFSAMFIVIDFSETSHWVYVPFDFSRTYPHD